SFCTITSSDFEGIPVGSKVVYAEPVNASGGLDSAIEVRSPGGGSITGHVVLDGATQTGTVTLSGGTGELAGLEAELAVAPLGEFADPAFPAPTVSVYESRRHPWVGLPDGIERS